VTTPLRRVSIQGYRAARELEFIPGSLCAFVGEASSGKSTVLTAIWTLLEAAAPPPTIDDVALEGIGGRIHLEADVAKGTIFLDARPPDTLNLNRAGAPPVLFLPANLRSRTSRHRRRVVARRRSPSSCSRRSSTTTGRPPTVGLRSSRGWSGCSRPIFGSSSC
jgi:energy-coupling factor transporter ATP-binding protein EcfA2